MLLFQIEFPDAPLMGMIYDETSKEKEPTFSHFVATPDMIELPKLQKIVAQGALNIKEGRYVIEPKGTENA